jgi:hypothetical protein
MDGCPLTFAIKKLSGFTWDDENGANINVDTLPVWQDYV